VAEVRASVTHRAEDRVTTVAARTATQRRDDDRVRYEALLARCPTVQLAAITNRWVSLVVCPLGEEMEPLRYSELSRKIPPVSQKMLTQIHCQLERDGFVTRTTTLAVPICVDYGLTPLGRRLHELLLMLEKCAEENIDEVNEARAHYDGEAAAGNTPGGASAST
jgi:DNA-binding HxlR family transcriptional regulator